jgi:hypothetical protein
MVFRRRRLDRLPRLEPLRRIAQQIGQGQHGSAQQVVSMRISSAQSAAQLSLQADATARELAAPISPPVADTSAARDMWQVVDHVSTLELGGADNSAQTHRIDLSRIVSKYIGEAERNLDAVFDRAQRSDSALLFDEADALLGKRSEVKDSHDRYANLEVNHLLQRIERHEGVAMLATNSQAPIDPDALKRSKAHVQLAAPPEPPRSRA